MVSNYEVVKSVQDVIAHRTGKTHISSRWSTRLLYHHLNNFRARVIWENIINKNIPISDYLIETIPCMPLIDVPSHECICVVEGRVIKKTRYSIPDTISGDIYAVMDLGGTGYDPVSWVDLTTPSNSIFKGRREGCKYTRKTILGQSYVYIIMDPHMDTISLQIIPKDPLELFKIPDCNGKINKCFDPWTFPFKIPPELLSMVYRLFATEILNMSGVALTDIEQDFLDAQQQRYSKK